MRTWTATSTSTRTPAVVLDLLTDTDACRQWSPVPFDLDGDAGARLAAGSRMRVSGQLVGRRVGFDVEVHEADDGRLALSAHGPVAFDVAYEARPAGGGSEVCASVSVRSGGGLLRPPGRAGHRRAPAGRRARRRRGPHRALRDRLTPNERNHPDDRTDPRLRACHHGRGRRARADAPLRRRRVRRRRAARRLARRPRRPVHGRHGAVRLGQVDADAPARRASTARPPGTVHIGGEEISSMPDRRLTKLRRTPHRLRLPVVQPAADADARRRTSCCRSRSRASSRRRPRSTRCSSASG